MPFTADMRGIWGREPTRQGRGRRILPVSQFLSQPPLVARACVIFRRKAESLALRALRELRHDVHAVGPER